MNLIKKIKTSTRIILLIRWIATFFYFLQDIILYATAFILNVGNVKKIINKQITIVTASDTSHFLSVKQLISSINHFERKSKIIFYDLGLREEEKEEIKNMNLIYKIFKFEDFPDYVNIKEKNSGAYAWKPQIINEEINNGNELLIWMDAGNKITRNLNKFRIILTFYGFFSPLSNGHVEQWTHIKTLKQLQIKNKIYKKRMLNAAIVGFNPIVEKNLDFIRVWSKLSLRQEIISPDGCGKHNHRFDQSLLTVLFYNSFNKLFFNRTHRWLGILIHQDID